MGRHLQLYSLLCLTRMMKWQSLFALGKLIQMVPLLINSTLCFIKFCYVAVIWVSLSCYNNLRCRVRCQNPKPSFNFGAPYGANTGSDLWEIQIFIEYFYLGHTHGLHQLKEHENTHHIKGAEDTKYRCHYSQSLPSKIFNISQSEHEGCISTRTKQSEAKLYDLLQASKGKTTGTTIINTHWSNEHNIVKLRPESVNKCKHNVSRFGHSNSFICTKPCILV